MKLTNFVTVFRTGQLVLLDWASNELEAAGIAHQRREETSGGLRLAMPAAPSTGPGTWWSVIVPESEVTRAQELLAGLPFESGVTGDVWDFQPRKGVKLAWQIYAWTAIGIVALGALIYVVTLFRLLK